MTEPPFDSWHEEVCDQMVESIKCEAYTPISSDTGCFKLNLGTDCAHIVALTMGDNPGEFFLTVRKAPEMSPVGL